MEAVKNRLTQLGWNARAFVVDADADLVPDMSGGDLDQPARRCEADRIVYKVVDGAGKAARLADDKGAGPPRPGEGDPDIAGFAPSLPSRHQVADQHPEVDRLEPGPGQLGVGPRRFPDVADQPVEPDHVL